MSVLLVGAATIADAYHELYLAGINIPGIRENEGLVENVPLCHPVYQLALACQVHLFLALPSYCPNHIRYRQKEPGSPLVFSEKYLLKFMKSSWLKRKTAVIIIDDLSVFIQFVQLIIIMINLLSIIIDHETYK